MLFTNMKKKYSFLGNIIFHLKSAKKWNNKLLSYQFLPVLPDILSAFCAIYLPAMIVQMIDERKELGGVVLNICIVAGCIIVCNAISTTMIQYLYRNSMCLTLYYDKLCFKKIMKIPYDELENKDKRVIFDNVWNTLRNEFTIRNSVTAMPVFLIVALNAIIYGILLARISLFLLLVLLSNVFVNTLLIKRARGSHEKYYKELGEPTRGLSYVNQYTMDSMSGKDIRIFQMQEWFMKKYDILISKVDKLYGKIHLCYYARRVQELTLNLFTELLSYGYLTYLLLEQRQTPAEFVFSIGVVRSFLGCFAELVAQTKGLNAINIFISYLRELLDIEEDSNKNLISKKGGTIELKDVSFRYPDSDVDVLSHINLKISEGEKIALIGLNGSGKTTLVKLICGLYKPSQGTILINGVEQERYSRYDYLSNISTLFQDSFLLPLTLDENITCELPEKRNNELLGKVLDCSNCTKIYEQCAKKGATVLNKEINEGAMDFSGGEKQKILFARALYKQAPILILDEPTAALDPIAENRLYEDLSAAASGSTTIFISHRLASTRFCNRILLLENSNIIEEGTHDELLRKGGRYTELYEIQRRYYSEECNSERIV